MRILVVQGANMVHLGRREPDLYGRVTAAELDARLQAHATETGLSLDIFYTNTEGEAIDRIYAAAAEGMDGILLNPAGFQYAGFALRDCLKGVRETLPCVEVHVTKKSIEGGLHTVTAEAARGMICGFGIDSYVLGLDALVRMLRRSASRHSGTAKPGLEPMTSDVAEGTGGPVLHASRRASAPGIIGWQPV